MVLFFTLQNLVSSSGVMELSTRYIDQLKGESDWPIWKNRIKDVIDYHAGALAVIDGSLVEPREPEDGASKEEKKKFEGEREFYRKANSYAKYTLSSSLSPEVYRKVMDRTTAKEMWDALRELFEASSEDQLFRVCNSFFMFSWDETDDVATHTSKLRTLWHELNDGLVMKKENRLPDLLLVCKLLNILPKKFESFKASWYIISKGTNNDFSELCNQLTLHERNFVSVKGNSSEALPVTNAKKEFTKADKRKFKCHYCGQVGHFVRKCKKWIHDGRPPKENKQETSAAANSLSLVSLCSTVNAVNVNENSWWFDNGATHHLTNSSANFVEFKKFDIETEVKAAGNEVLKAVGSGTINIRIKGRRGTVALRDVWLVPSINRNIFSVLSAHDKNPGSKYESTTTRCSFKIADEEIVVGSREKSGTLYLANFVAESPASTASVQAVSTDESTLQLYHERWGHQDKRHVCYKLKHDLGIEVKLDDRICESCIVGKSSRLPFGNREKAKICGELLSADIVGPFKPSFSGRRYLIVFKDAFSKCRFTFVTKTKSKEDVLDCLTQVLSHAKTVGHTIQEFLTDGGGEFDNLEVKKLLSDGGIVHRITAPYTPQQNGNTERENRTIIEMARTFCYSNPDIKFPDAIWAELVTAASYILNRTGKSSIQGVSPFECWLGKKPRIHHLRIVASRCFVHVPAEKRTKMGAKAKEGFLVGYDGDERYRIYLPQQGKVVVSRDVRFLEKLKPCVNKIPIIPGQETEKTTDDHNNNESSNDESIEPEKAVEKSSDEEDGVEKETMERHRELRDRSKLKIPARLQDCIFVCDTSEIPDTYEKAIASNEAEWKKAMKSEIESLKENSTWELSDLPKDRRAIPCKWVYKIKLNADGSIDRYKARLVVKGYSQREGVDYQQTFAPVTRMATIRSVISVAASENLKLAQFDVSTAFLYGELKEDIYMLQPKGFDDGSGRVCKLKRSLYGLKQAPRCWNQRFGQFIEKLGFKPSNADPCLYFNNVNGRKMILALYVDDGLVAASDQQELDEFLSKLKDEFKIRSSEANYFLGLEIQRSSDGIKISQEAYAKKMLEKFGFSECKPVSTPMEKGSASIDKNEIIDEKDFPYRRVVGSLMYLMIGSRPDLAFSVGFLSRSLENPTKEDVIRTKRVLRYVAGTLSRGITYLRSAETVLQGYSDADLSGCNKTMRSTTGVIVTYAGGAVSWISQRQRSVATSTTEAEIIAASEAGKEVIWLKMLFEQIVDMKKKPTIFVDNSAAVKLSYNPELHRRTKHIERRHFYIRELVTMGKVDVQQISTTNQLADLLTKALPSPRLEMLLKRMGI